MKVVLDTNVVISALLHPGSTRRFYELWRSRKIELLATQPILEEYIRVLHYSKFGYEPTVIAEILDENLLPWVTKVEEYRGKLRVPPKDKNDEMFLRAALAGKAEVLVSGDIHLTSLEGQYAFPIIAPAVFLSRYFKKS